MRETFELDGSDGQPVPVTLRRTGAREWVNHIARLGEAHLVDEAAPRFEGNRRTRRRAAAQARKGVPASAPEPVDPHTIRAMFAEAEAEVTRNKRVLSHMEFTREWQAVQALPGRIIDTATPEQRAAREAAVAEEWERLRLAEEASDAVAGNPANPKPGPADPMDPAPPWLAPGEEWLRQHAEICRNPSRYMP